MPEPITTGVAIAVGGWFAGKVFGPSADVLGQSLKAHLENRIPTIFGRAEQIAKAESVELNAIKPGLLTRMIVDASFSEDTLEITEWWANLFVDASIRGDNTHATFSDIMALIGPKEAACLSQFFEIAAPQWGAYTDGGKIDQIALSGVVYQELVSRFERLLPMTEAQWREVSVVIATAKLPLPVRALAWSLPVKFDEDEKAKFPLNTEIWYSSNKLSFEILQRAGVVRVVRVPVSIMSSNVAWIDFLELTTLGHEFCMACTGKRLKQ